MWILDMYAGGEGDVIWGGVVRGEGDVIAGMEVFCCYFDNEGVLEEGVNDRGYTAAILDG